MKPVQIIKAAAALLSLLGLSLWWAFAFGSHDVLADLRQKPVPIAFAGTPPALPPDLVIPEEVRPGTVSPRSRALWIAEEHWPAYATAEAAAALRGELKAGKVILFLGKEPPLAVTEALGVAVPTLPPIADDGTRQHALYLWQDHGGMTQAGVVLGGADLTTRRLHEALAVETAYHLDHQSRNASLMEQSLAERVSGWRLLQRVERNWVFESGNRLNEWVRYYDLPPKGGTAAEESYYLVVYDAQMLPSRGWSSDRLFIGWRGPEGTMIHGYGPMTLPNGGEAQFGRVTSRLGSVPDSAVSLKWSAGDLLVADQSDPSERWFRHLYQYRGGETARSANYQHAGWVARADRPWDGACTQRQVHFRRWLRTEAVLASVCDDLGGQR